MPRTRRQRRFLTGLAWVSVFATLLLAGVLGRAWALPGRVPLGQTIPPPPTATPTNTVSAELTATWTPRPTWTLAPTQPPEPPTATPTAVVILPTATQPPTTATQVPSQATATSLPTAPGPTMTAVLPGSTSTVQASPTMQSSGTPARPLPTASRTSTSTPTATPAKPVPLVFEVAIVPQVAGPRDAVQFILQVANVGYTAVDDVQVAAVFPDDLWLQLVECPRCTTDCPDCRGGVVTGKLTISIGRILPGEQVIAPVHVQVADDVWPGQTLHTDWTLTSTSFPAQAVQAALVLPWVPLPSTGGE